MEKVLKFCLMCMMVASVVSYGTTVAHWDFEDGVAGQPFDPDGGGDSGSADLVGGYVMYGWDGYWGPGWASGSPGGIGSLVMNNADNHQDGYHYGSGLVTWSPETWTIECHVMLQEIAGWETIIGRDGTAVDDGAGSDFYLSNNGIDDKFRVNIHTVGGARWILDGDYTVKTSHWYGLAAMSDGVTLSLWLDDSTGYQMIGSLDISAQTVAENALADAGGANWTFGRGWYYGFVDHIDGQMDNIRFSDTALAADELIPLVVPEPATMVLLGLGSFVMLRKRK
jgi:hypothetical protein